MYILLEVSCGLFRLGCLLIKIMQIQILDTIIKLDVGVNLNDWPRDLSTTLPPQNEVNGLLLDVLASS